MEEYKTKRIRYVEVAKDIYAAITPTEGLDITDAGMMDNFSNSAYINRGEGLVSDTFFDLPMPVTCGNSASRRAAMPPNMSSIPMATGIISGAIRFSRKPPSWATRIC